MVVSRSDAKRRRKDGATPEESLQDSPKRTKVHAQRKFAQGSSNLSSPALTPIKDREKVKTNGSVLSSEVLPTNMPKTEDFLTFLSFRNSSILPPSLAFFNIPNCYREREEDEQQQGESSRDSTRNSRLTPTASSSNRPSRSAERGPGDSAAGASTSKKGECSGTAKRTENAAVGKKTEKTEDRTKKTSVAVMALRKKYHQQRLEKSKATSINKLAQKVKGKNMVRTRSSALREDGRLEKDKLICQIKTKSAIESKIKLKRALSLGRVITRNQAVLHKKPFHSAGNRGRAGLRSGGSVNDIPFAIKATPAAKKSIPGPSVENNEKKDKHHKEKSHIEDKTVKEKTKEFASTLSDFSSDDDQPLAKKLKPVEKIGKMVSSSKKLKSQMVTRSKQPKEDPKDNMDTGSNNISARPSRKTKEAATLYMELLGKKLISTEEDGDDDTLSIESFPELPNVRRTEQREREIKTKIEKERSEMLKENSNKTGKSKQEKLQKTAKNNETNKNSIKKSDSNTSKETKKDSRDSVKPKNVSTSEEKPSTKKKIVKKSESLPKKKSLRVDSDDGKTKKEIVEKKLMRRRSLRTSEAQSDDTENVTVTCKEVSKSSKGKSSTVKLAVTESNVKDKEAEMSDGKFSDSDEEPLHVIALKKSCIFEESKRQDTDMKSTNQDKEHEIGIKEKPNDSNEEMLSLQNNHQNTKTCGDKLKPESACGNADGNVNNKELSAIKDSSTETSSPQMLNERRNESPNKVNDNVPLLKIPSVFLSSDSKPKFSPQKGSPPILKIPVVHSRNQFAKHDTYGKMLGQEKTDNASDSLEKDVSAEIVTPTDLLEYEARKELNISNKVKIMNKRINSKESTCTSTADKNELSASSIQEVGARTGTKKASKSKKTSKGRKEDSDVDLAVVSNKSNAKSSNNLQNESKHPSADEKIQDVGASPSKEVIRIPQVPHLVGRYYDEKAASHNETTFRKIIGFDETDEREINKYENTFSAPLVESSLQQFNMSLPELMSPRDDRFRDTKSKVRVNMSTEQIEKWLNESCMENINRKKECLRCGNTGECAPSCYEDEFDDLSDFSLEKLSLDDSSKSSSIDGDRPNVTKDIVGMPKYLRELSEDHQTYIPEKISSLKLDEFKQKVSLSSNMLVPGCADINILKFSINTNDSDKSTFDTSVPGCSRISELPDRDILVTKEHEDISYEAGNSLKISKAESSLKVPISEVVTKSSFKDSVTKPAFSSPAVEEPTKPKQFLPVAPAPVYNSTKASSKVKSISSTSIASADSYNILGRKTPNRSIQLTQPSLSTGSTLNNPSKKVAPLCKEKENPLIKVNLTDQSIKTLANDQRNKFIVRDQLPKSSAKEMPFKEPANELLKPLEKNQSSLNDQSFDLSSKEHILTSPLRKQIVSPLTKEQIVVSRKQAVILPSKPHTVTSQVKDQAVKLPVETKGTKMSVERFNISSAKKLAVKLPVKKLLIKSPMREELTSSVKEQGIKLPLKKQSFKLSAENQSDQISAKQSSSSPSKELLVNSPMKKQESVKPSGQMLISSSEQATSVTEKPGVKSSAKVPAKVSSVKSVNEQILVVENPIKTGSEGETVQQAALEFPIKSTTEQNLVVTSATEKLLPQIQTEATSKMPVAAGSDHLNMTEKSESFGPKRSLESEKLMVSQDCIQIQSGNSAVPVCQSSISVTSTSLSHENDQPLATSVFQPAISSIETVSYSVTGQASGNSNMIAQESGSSFMPVSEQGVVSSVQQFECSVIKQQTESTPETINMIQQQAEVPSIEQPVISTTCEPLNSYVQLPTITSIPQPVYSTVHQLVTSIPQVFNSNTQQGICSTVQSFVQTTPETQINPAVQSSRPAVQPPLHQTMTLPLQQFITTSQLAQAVGPTLQQSVRPTLQTISLPMNHPLGHVFQQSVNSSFQQTGGLILQQTGAAPLHTAPYQQSISLQLQQQTVNVPCQQTVTLPLQQLAIVPLKSVSLQLQQHVTGLPFQQPIPSSLAQSVSLQLHQQSADMSFQPTAQVTHSQPTAIPPPQLSLNLLSQQQAATLHTPQQTVSLQIQPSTNTLTQQTAVIYPSSVGVSQHTQSGSVPAQDAVTVLAASSHKQQSTIIIAQKPENVIVAQKPLENVMFTQKPIENAIVSQKHIENIVVTQNQTENIVVTQNAQATVVSEITSENCVSHAPANTVVSTSNSVETTQPSLSHNSEDQNSSNVSLNQELPNLVVSSQENNILDENSSQSSVQNNTDISVSQKFHDNSVISHPSNTAEQEGSVVAAQNSSNSIANSQESESVSALHVSNGNSSTQVSGNAIIEEVDHSLAEVKQDSSFENQQNESELPNVTNDSSKSQESSQEVNDALQHTAFPLEVSVISSISDVSSEKARSQQQHDNIEITSCDKTESSPSNDNSTFLDENTPEIAIAPSQKEASNNELSNSECCDEDTRTEQSSLQSQNKALLVENTVNREMVPLSAGSEASSNKSIDIKISPVKQPASVTESVATECQTGSEKESNVTESDTSKNTDSETESVSQNIGTASVNTKSFCLPGPSTMKANIDQKGIKKCRELEVCDKITKSKDKYVSKTSRYQQRKRLHTLDKKLIFHQRSALCSKGKDRKDLVPSANAFSLDDESSVYAFQADSEEVTPMTTPFRRKVRDSQSSSAMMSKSEEDVSKLIDEEACNLERKKSASETESLYSEKIPSVTVQPLSSQPSQTKNISIPESVTTRTSTSIAVQVNLDEELEECVSPVPVPAAVDPELTFHRSTEISTQTESDDDNKNENHLFYIPLQQSSNIVGSSSSSNQQLIQGVAVELGTEGPTGPNQRVIMRAKLVTKPATFIPTSTGNEDKSGTYSKHMFRIKMDELLNSQAQRPGTMLRLEQKTQYGASAGSPSVTGSYPPVGTVQPTARSQSSSTSSTSQSSSSTSTATSTVETSAALRLPETVISRQVGPDNSVKPLAVVTAGNTTSSTSVTPTTLRTEQKVPTHVHDKRISTSDEVSMSERRSQSAAPEKKDGSTTMGSIVVSSSPPAASGTTAIPAALSKSSAVNTRERRSSTDHSTIASASSSRVPAHIRRQQLKAKVSRDANYMLTPTVVTSFPSVGDPAQLVEAPTFHPTEKEFQDPLEYFDKIRPIAEKFGLCRIVPPSNFKPECKVNDEMRFTAYNQYVHKMLHRWGPNVKEMLAMKKYLATQEIKFDPPPLIGGMEVDFPRLYSAVQSFGGLKQVIEKQKWQRVADFIRVPKSAQDRAQKLFDIYLKYLLPYDTLCAVEREGLLEDVEREWLEREKKVNDEEDAEEDESESTDDETNIFEENEECIVKGRGMPLSAFYRIARNTMSMWFRQSEPSSSEVEQEFWKLVVNRSHHVCVHSGSIDSSGYGYGFPVSKNSPFAKHPWNLKILTNSNGSVLRSMGPVMGVTVPTLHVGMVFTTCCWYRDPHGLPWIEYLHTGASKIWYGIPDEFSSLFRSALMKLVPKYCRSKTIWLPSDTAMIPPQMLVKEKVSLCKTVQEPGQFIMVFPRAFTSSICTGYLVSESVYFAQPSWLTTAEQVFKDIHDSCEPSMFSLDKLLFNIANDVRTHVDVLKQVLPMIVRIKQRELDYRKELFALGLKNSERLPLPDANSKKRKGKAAPAPEEDIEEECETCRASLFVSFVANSHEDCVYCLPHAIQLLKKKQNYLKQCKLHYTYSQMELNDLIQKLEDKIECKTQKKLPGKHASSTSKT